MICDLGCEQGRTTLRLARHHPCARIIALDGSGAMTAAAQQRCAGLPVQAITSDFHNLPLTEHSLDLVVAVMCLYHSPAPDTALREITRTLRPGGTAILVTKAADSYHELAALVQRSGLDPHATARPSLYQAAHSGNLPALADTGGLTITQTEHEQHTFTFTDLAHTAAYLATCPQYPFLADLRYPAALRDRLPDGPVTTTATITYVIGRP